MMLAAAMRTQWPGASVTKDTSNFFSRGSWAETADATDAMPNLKQLVESGLPRTRRKGLRVVVLRDLVREAPPIPQVVDS